MELEVQKFLRNDGTLDELEQKYAIANKRHCKFNNIVLLKYNQIESPFSEQIVRECRGIILNENDNWHVVGRAFDKFFNSQQPFAADIVWETARVQEKLDGSMCLLYHYVHPGTNPTWEESWHVATTGSPDATGNVNSHGITFAKLFWEIYKLCGYGYNLHPDLCYIFELTSPYNRVVIPHQTSDLTLLAVRSKVSGREIPVNLFKDKFKVVKAYPLKDIESIIASFPPTGCESEGYVVVDMWFNRIKVKNPVYVALHHMRDSFSFKTATDIVRKNETSELISYFPEFKVELDKIQEKYNLLVQNLEESYNNIKHLESQKEFALEAIKTRCSAALFDLRKGKVSNIKEYLSNMPLNSLVEILQKS